MNQEYDARATHWAHKSYEIICDSKATFDIAHDLVLHNKTKYIEVDRHFIKKKLEAIIIKIPQVRLRLAYQCADQDSV